MLTEAGLRVSTIFGPTFRPLDADRALGQLGRATSRAPSRRSSSPPRIGAASVYVCSGAAPTLTWEEAAAAFSELVAPAVERSVELGVPLLLEPTNPLRADVSFVFWQRDAMDLARQAGTKVMLDFQSCWYERGLEDIVRRNIDLVGVVQLSDYVIGTDPDGRPGGPRRRRRAPRATDRPWSSTPGYEGAFDLEVMGPRVEEEGYAAASVAPSSGRASSSSGSAPEPQTLPRLSR